MSREKQMISIKSLEGKEWRWIWNSKPMHWSIFFFQNILCTEVCTTSWQWQQACGRRCFMFHSEHKGKNMRQQPNITSIMSWKNVCSRVQGKALGLEVAKFQNLLQNSKRELISHSLLQTSDPLSTPAWDSDLDSPLDSRENGPRISSGAVKERN